MFARPDGGEHVDYAFLNQNPASLKEVTFMYDGYGPSLADSVTPVTQDFELYDLPVEHDRFLENYEHFLSSRQILTDPHTDTQVATYWANRDQLQHNSDNLMAIVTTWTSSLESNGGNRREYALAAAMNPDVPFVIIDNPGSGFSDKLPGKLMKRMTKTGEFNEAGSILTRALATKDYYPRAITGASAGGRYALGMARGTTADNVERIGVIDPVGQAEFGRFKLALRMGKELLKHAPEYGKASEDVYLYPHKNFDTPEEWERMVGPKELNTQMKQNKSRIQKFWQLPKAMTNQDGFAVDMVSALENYRGTKLTYIEPQKSELTRGSLRGEAAQFLANVSLASLDVRLIERVRILGVPEATHYFTSAYPRKVGSLIAEIIK